MSLCNKIYFLCAAIDSKIEVLKAEVESWIVKLKASEEEKGIAYQVIEAKKKDIERLQNDVIQQQAIVDSLNESTRELKAQKSDLENKIFMQSIHVLFWV